MKIFHSKYSGRCYTCAHEDVCQIRSERAVLQEKILELIGREKRKQLYNDLSDVAKENFTVCAACDSYLNKYETSRN